MNTPQAAHPPRRAYIIVGLLVLAGAAGSFAAFLAQRRADSLRVQRAFEREANMREFARRALELLESCLRGAPI